MTSTTGWITGRGNTNAGLTWYSAGFSNAASDWNSLANGSSVVAGTAFVNGTNLDQYAEVSFVMTVGGTTLASSGLGLFLLPLNQDGSTFGDGAANGATPPVAEYAVGWVGVRPGVTSGNTITGTFRPAIILPPGSMKFVITNNLGIALNATAAATVQIRTFNENLNA